MDRIRHATAPRLAVHSRGPTGRACTSDTVGIPARLHKAGRPSAYSGGTTVGRGVFHKNAHLRLGLTAYTKGALDVFHRFWRTRAQAAGRITTHGGVPPFHGCR